MKKLILAAALFAAFNAYADSTHETTTTGGNLENTINNSPINTASAIAGGGAGGNGFGGAGGSGGAGGAGGLGGAGGSANQGQQQSQSMIGSGNSSIRDAGNSQSSSGVIGSGNSSNHNSNAAGVYGSGNSANSNRTESTATGGNSNANGGNSTATGGAGGNSGGNSQSIYVGGDSYNNRNPAASAHAPNIAPTSPCMGSTSGGVQGMSFGVSVGSSWVDTNCQLLEQVRTVATVLGEKDVAAEMMAAAVPAYAAARAKVRGEPVAKQAVETQSVDLYAR